MSKKVNMYMQLKETFEKVKRASKSLALLSDDQRNEILLAVADAILNNKVRILDANAQDLAKMSKENPLYDRLQLTESRLEGIASDMRNVATLPSPLGHITKQKTLSNGLRLCRVSVPFGVIGMIYEARPNVTFDVFSLCFKSGNACVLKGGKDADCSNREEVALIHEILEKFGVNPDVVALLPATHEATGEMLNAVGYVDLCIPRGGRKLIDFVRDTARIPVIETGAGVVNTYFDKDGDLEMGKAIINNAKTRRVSVCNALDCLLIHQERLVDLVELVGPMAEKNVIIYADEKAYAALEGKYPYLEHATKESFGTEFMDYKLAIKTVASLEEALDHIDENGSGHSEAIVTMNEATARKFQAHVDAACVYWNAPTSFTDGAQFGLGAEIGISTQKLGPRGPMALEEICTYKWLIEGEGQTRP
jgi:glutamate-5-semialdehyde dehydrogenase